MEYLVAVDIGGTFTDFILLDTGSQRLVLNKYPSTPEDPSEALIQGLREQRVIPRPGINLGSKSCAILARLPAGILHNQRCEKRLLVPFLP